MKNILFLFILLLIAIVLYFLALAFMPKSHNSISVPKPIPSYNSQLPTGKQSGIKNSSGFRGPTGPPHIKGPSGPPPSK